MPNITSSTFESPFWLPNGHFQSIFPSLFRKVKGITYQRERITTPDADFLDLDWAVVDKSKNLVIISHGLEGDSHRQYMTGMVKYFNQNDYNCLAWNFRSCSGEMNLQSRFYHSGATDDLNIVVNYAISKGFETISLIGFSLGGNLTIKYLGENPEALPKVINKAVVFSVPLHLSSSSDKMATWQDWIYDQRFRRSLLKKVIEKAEKMPEKIDISKISQIKNLRDFDDQFTSILHGFKDAEDYYQQNSSLFFLEKITVPTLIINAQNDPFLSPACFPVKQLENHKSIYLEIPATGGHCGFYQKDFQGVLWSEKRAVEFIGLGRK